jgi:hypothetical protein
MLLGPDLFDGVDRVVKVLPSLGATRFDLKYGMGGLSRPSYRSTGKVFEW